MKITHVGVVRRKQHTVVSRNPGQDQRFGFQVIQQYFQRRGKEAGVLWFEHEIIVLFWLQDFGDRLTATAIAQQMLERLLEIRLPLSKVIVDVNDRNTVF